MDSSTPQTSEIKWSRLPMLTGSQNYIQWANAWRITLADYKCWQVVNSTIAKLTGEPLEAAAQATMLRNSLEL